MMTAMENVTSNIHIRCTVRRKVFFDGKDGFCIFTAIQDGGVREFTVTGHSFDVTEGIHLDVEGSWKEHKTYGRNFSAVSWFEVRPETLEGIEKYLASGKVRGIGKKFAHAIVARFGHDTFEIIENYPDYLTEIPRFGKERAQQVSKFIKQQSLERDVTVFLASFGISTTFVKKIIKVFGYSAVSAVRDNPYCLIEHIDGIGFRLADKIAKAMGYADDDPRRLQAGVIFIMTQVTQNGDCYIPYPDLVKAACGILHSDEEKVGYAIRQNFRLGKLINDESRVYHADYYYAECYCASFIMKMVGNTLFTLCENADTIVRHVVMSAARKGVEYDDVQVSAIKTALTHRVMILTGGPGTGKTTVLKGILQALHQMDVTIAVCAPTGRAAKRAKESTGYDASTIHRLLSFSWEINGFKHNEDNQLEEEVIVIDEFSMVDILLFQSLLKAMTPWKRLIIVGDVDQLPSVGAGNVLKDLIESRKIPVVRLETIHRQDPSSRIPMNAKAIKEGRMPVLDNRGSKDFFFIPRTDEQAVCDEILSLVTDRLPKAYGVAVSDIQVLCPMRKARQKSDGGDVSVKTCCTYLNHVLQATLNAEGPALQYGSIFYRKGDRVMQMKNNYEKGVFNGDVGTITTVDEELGILYVKYPDYEKAVKYEEDDLDELDLSYATTIHKSQGSEYNTVIIPLLNSAFMMLQRNLIYTAVTRAKERCIIIGDRQALFAAVTNMYLKNRRLFVNRQTWLKERLYHTPHHPIL